MTDHDYMRRAIALAGRGLGWTNPNPMVGAVIVKNGTIIGEGWHEKCGGLHAERNAFASLTADAKDATLYVTLEPCCHYGKTPPCTEAILEHGIRRVVIGSRDPNPMVAGKGTQILRQAGIQVEEDFLREECDAINPVFFHYITTKTPYVVMKYAMTADGKIATKTGASKWITGEAAREQVHYMRHRYMGIMAGIGTVLEDDPMLNVRLDHLDQNLQLPGIRNPIRIICDSHLRIPLDSRICQSADTHPTIVAYSCAEEETIKQLEDLQIQTVFCPDQEGRVDLKRLMQILGQQGIDSILLEGGGTLNESVLRTGIVQRMEVFIAPKIFGGEHSRTPVAGEGVCLPSECFPLKLLQSEIIGEDLHLSYEILSESISC